MWGERVLEGLPSHTLPYIVCRKRTKFGPIAHVGTQVFLLVSYDPIGRWHAPTVPSFIWTSIYTHTILHRTTNFGTLIPVGKWRVYRDQLRFQFKGVGHSSSKFL